MSDIFKKYMEKVEEISEGQYNQGLNDELSNITKATSKEEDIEDSEEDEDIEDSEEAIKPAIK